MNITRIVLQNGYECWYKQFVLEKWCSEWGFTVTFHDDYSDDHIWIPSLEVGIEILKHNCSNFDMEMHDRKIYLCVYYEGEDDGIVKLFEDKKEAIGELESLMYFGESK